MLMKIFISQHIFIFLHFLKIGAAIFSLNSQFTKNTIPKRSYSNFKKIRNNFNHYIAHFLGSNQLHGRESITMESAKILLKRGLRKVSDTEDKWEFTRDLKHRIAALYGYPQEVVRRLASEVINLNLRSI